MIPAHLLNRTADVQVREGSGQTARWGDPWQVRCRVDATRKLVQDAQGREVVAEVTLYALPSADVPLSARVLLDGRYYTVISTQTHDGPSRPALVEVSLK